MASLRISSGDAKIWWASDRLHETGEVTHTLKPIVDFIEHRLAEPAKENYYKKRVERGGVVVFEDFNGAQASECLRVPAFVCGLPSDARNRPSPAVPQDPRAG